MKAAALCEDRERKGDDALSEQESTLTSHLTAAPITPAAESPSPKKNRKKNLAGLRGRLYRFCAFNGLVLIRRGRWIRRRLLGLLTLCIGLLSAFGERIVRSVKIFAVRNGISLDMGAELFASLRKGNAEARGQGAAAWLKFWIRVLLALLAQGVSRLVRSVNYLAPLAAAAVFLAAVQVVTHTQFGLQVVYNGEELGCIADESVFTNAEKQMLGRIVFEDYIKPDNAVPEFTIAALRRKNLLSEDELTDALIRASGNELTEATGLYVEDKFFGAVEDRTRLLKLLDNIKDQYRSEEYDPTETVEFVKEVEARDGLYPVSSVISLSEMGREVTREEQQQRVYTAVQGDAPIIIAQKNGIPYSQLKALNPDIEQSLLVGQEVLVSKAVPALEVKVVREVVEEVETNFKIEQIQDTDQFQGYVKVMQKGEKGLTKVTSRVSYIDGVEVDREEIDSEVISEPITEKVIVGGKRPLDKIPSGGTASGNFIWPAAGGYVSCGFYGYWGHTGMDIACNYGTPVYAAASGTVTKAVYNTTGYGYHIIISHGGGVETLYGHNSKLYVKAGDWVEQGQLIAAVGRTGRASGNHVHFEIRVNGRYMNPANYIGTVSPY